MESQARCYVNGSTKELTNELIEEIDEITNRRINRQILVMLLLLIVVLTGFSSTLGLAVFMGLSIINVVYSVGFAKKYSKLPKKVLKDLEKYEFFLENKEDLEIKKLVEPTPIGKNKASTNDLEEKCDIFQLDKLSLEQLKEILVSENKQDSKINEYESNSHQKVITKFKKRP